MDIILFSGRMRAGELARPCRRRPPITASLHLPIDHLWVPIDCRSIITQRLCGENTQGSGAEGSKPPVSCMYKQTIRTYTALLNVVHLTSLVYVDAPVAQNKTCSAAMMAPEPQTNCVSFCSLRLQA
jgi:hypothetical protein